MTIPVHQHSRNMSIKFDSNGNIDPSSLEKDLQDALDSDVKYRQTDNMKKRAIKVASSYDEFKNMVACAHLKTLSSKDIESLKEVKKGWKKQNTGISSKSLLLDGDEHRPIAGTLSRPELPADREKPPKSFMDFQKVWRRLDSSSKKYNYLSQVGPARLQRLLNAECDVEVLEEILVVLATDSGSNIAASRESTFSFIRALVEVNGFSFNAKFFGSATKDALNQYFSGSTDAESAALLSRLLS